MAIGYENTIATGLQVFNMNNFNHPGGFSISTPEKCGKIFCNWKEDSGSHFASPPTNEGLWTTLERNSAVRIGVLDEMDCNGNSIYSNMGKENSKD